MIDRRYQAVRKNWKRIGDSDTINKNIRPGYRNGIWHRKMCHAHNENWKKRNNGRNKTDKSRNNQSVWKKMKMKTTCDYWKRTPLRGDERKHKKRESQASEKTRKQILQQKSHWMDKHRMDKRGTQTNGSEDKKVVDGVQGFTSER